MSINSMKNAIIKPTTNLLNKTKNIGDKLLNPNSNKNKNIGDKIKNGISSITNTTKEKIGDIGKKINEVLPKGENKPSVPISKLGQLSLEFLNANTAISKFVSFILFLLIFTSPTEEKDQWLKNARISFYVHGLAVLGVVASLFIIVVGIIILATNIKKH